MKKGILAFFLVCATGIVFSPEPARSQSEEMYLTDDQAEKVIQGVNEVRDYGNDVIQEIQGMVEEVEESEEKINPQVVECLNTNLKKANEIMKMVNAVREQTVTMLAANSFVGVFKNLRNISVMKKALGKVYEQALACLPSGFRAGEAKVIPPEVIWETEDFPLPDYSDEEELSISILI